MSDAFRDPLEDGLPDLDEERSREELSQEQVDDEREARSMGLRMAMWNLFGGQNRDGNLFLAWLSEECFEHDATWAPGCDDQEHAYNEGKRSIILKMRRSLMLAEEMAHGRRSDPDE